MSDWRVTFLIVSGLIVLAGCWRLAVLAQRAGTLWDLSLSVAVMIAALMPMAALVLRYLGVV